MSEVAIGLVRMGSRPKDKQLRVPMNPILEDILKRGVVTDGETELPLKDNMDETEGDLIRRCFVEVKPSLSIEIGCAYGISAMFACDALAFNGKPCRHIIFDPFQSLHWKSIGIRNLQRAGLPTGQAHIGLGRRNSLLLAQPR